MTGVSLLIIERQFQPLVLLEAVSSELSHEIDLAHICLVTRLLFARVKQSGLIQCDVEDQATIVAETDEGVGLTIELIFVRINDRRLTIREIEDRLCMMLLRKV